MPEILIYTIGFSAQLLFSVRLIFQWLQSEKSKRVITPASFWIHSLAASFLLFLYGYLRHDFAIMLGQTITYFIYIRNIQIMNEWQKINPLARLFLFLFPILIILYYFNNNRLDMQILLSSHNIQPWLLALGIVGQIVFTFRFILQWQHAEKTKKAELPLLFWYWSLLGSFMIIIYAILRIDPVLIIGQLFGFVVYTRNIILSKHHSHSHAD